MFSFLSLPTPSLRSISSLTPRKALFLFLLVISLLVSRPAFAQEPAGQWVASPCDANGKPLPYINQDQNGFYTMGGSYDWSYTNNYPSIFVTAARISPYGYGGYVNAGTPNAINVDTGLFPYHSLTSSGLGDISENFPNKTYAANFMGSSIDPNWWYDIYLDNSRSYGPINGATTADITGTLVYYFEVKWQSDSSETPDTPRPAYLNLMLHTHLKASASVYAAIPPVQSYLPTAGAQSLVTDGPPFNETAYEQNSFGATFESEGQATSPPNDVIGYHLVRAAVDPNTGIAKVSLNGELHWKSYNNVICGTIELSDPDGSLFGVQTGGPVAASASGFIEAGVRKDNREVAISSAIETSYFKTGDEHGGSPVQAQHYRNLDGSIAVDSAVDWVNLSDGSFKGWQIYSLPLTANASDFQDPSYAWSISGLSIDQAGLELPLSILSRTANFHLKEPDEDKFPLHCTVRVDVTDTDTAVAANTYDITWHLPYEKTAFLGSVPEKVKLEKLYGPIEEGGFSDVQASEGRDIDISEGCEIVGAAAAATGQEDIAAVLEIVGKLAKLTDTKYHYAGENIRKGTQNGQDKWDATLVNPDWAANVNNPDLLTHFNVKEKKFDGWAFCKLEIYEVKHYHHMTWAADKYNLHGYEGTGYTLHADPVDKIDEEPYYTQDLFLNPQ